MSTNVEPNATQALPDWPITGIHRVEASAGTGKTFALALLHTRLVVERALPVKRILAVTFTIAATQELRERLRVQLGRAAELALLDPVALAEKRNSADAAEAMTASVLERRLRDEPAAELATRLRRAVGEIDLAASHTIHAFCQRVLSEHALISAKGKDVVVIGGGDTGTDCVGTSMRHGAKSITQIEILPKPPMERASDNPWPEWPKVYKLDYGQEEAAAKFGADPRVYLTTVKKFVGDENGAVKELTTVQITWGKNEKGQFVPTEVPGTEQTRPAQLVLLAMGFLGPEQALLKDINLETDARSNIKAEHEKYTTNIKGVFAAGDCRRGQSLIVWAINEGRGAARECDRYLMGSTDLP